MNDLKKCSLDLFPAMVNTKDGQRYGYINSNGTFIIKPKYFIANNFNEHGIAIVCENNLCGGINSKGEYIIPQIYDSLQPFINERSVFTKGTTVGIIDENGQVISTNSYTFISNYSNSMALVGIPNDSNGYLFGYINKSGFEVIPPIFIEGNDFKDNHALVKNKDGLYQVINMSGNVTTTFPYKYVGNYGEKIFTFSKEFGSLIGYVSIDGHVVIKPKFTSAQAMEDGYMVVSTASDFHGNYGVIDITNHIIYPFIYNDIKYLGCNRFALGLSIGTPDNFVSSIYSIGKSNGTTLTDFLYLNVERYTENIASAFDNQNTFFIDLKGNIIMDLPIVKGSGTLTINCNLIYSYIDYNPYYITKFSDIVYKPNPQLHLNNEYILTILKYKPNVNYLVYYPQLEGLEYCAVQYNINSQLKDLSNLKKICENQVLDYTLYGNFKILYFNKDLLVLQLNSYNYPNGAAHGLTLRNTPNINLVTGEFYTLHDLFNGGIYWTKYINEIIEEMIKTDPQYSEVYKGSDGFKGISEDQTFYVDGDNLYIYFAPYDIAPYSTGFVTFKIPFKDIDKLINKNGGFYKSFN
ncbi:MAG: WG repeat-containing protein [Clostridium sp.]|uniref:WG repeat-containing protein n=1 Tax=Clostridium sp. TaxID=1506 RepID=UPI00302DB022